MEEVLKQLKEMQLSQQQESQMVRAELAQVVATNKEIEKKVDTIALSNSNLKTQIKGIEKRLDPLERERRQRNLLIYGQEEAENESWKDLEKIVLDILQKKMKVDVKPEELDKVRRVGKAENGKGRLIIVSFTTIRRKIEVMSQGKQLKGTTIRIQEDFPKEVTQTRKNLYSTMKSFRDQGRSAVLKYDKLYVDGTEWKEQEESGGQKRKPSLSPQITDNTRQQKKTKNDGIVEENLDISMGGYSTNSEEFALPKNDEENKQKEDE